MPTSRNVRSAARRQRGQSVPARPSRPGRGNRDARSAARNTRREETARLSEERRRVKLTETLDKRLQSMPPTWRRQYNEKLKARDIAVRRPARPDVDELQERVKLLPPPVVYQHHRGAHGSALEYRGVLCKNMAGKTKDYVKKTCVNHRVWSPATLMIPERRNLGRLSPKNVHAFLVQDRWHCCNKKQLRIMYKHGYTWHSTAQLNSRAREWPELALDLSTDDGEVLTIRAPYHVMAECGSHFQLPTKAELFKRKNELQYNWSRRRRTV